MTKGGKYHEPRRRRIKRMFIAVVHIICTLMVPFPLDPKLKEAP
jgi:hypothetical protein